MLCRIIIVAALIAPLWAIPPGVRLDSLVVRHWSGAAGLPEETYSALLAPPGGFLWIASNNGLIRFDGRRAEVFRPSQFFPTESERPCASNSFNNLGPGRAQGFWASTQSGCLFHMEPDRFGTYANFRFRALEAAGLKPDVGAIVRLDTEGERPLLMRRGGISDWPQPPVNPPDSIQIEQFREAPRLAPPPGLLISSTSQTSSGLLYAVMSDRQVFLHQNSDGWKPLFRIQAPPRRLLASRDGRRLWASSTEGLFEWQDGQLRQLETNEVGALLEDQHGCLWIGGWQRVVRRCGASREELPLGVPQEEIHSTLAEDDQGRIWVGGRWGNLFRLSASPFQVLTRRQGMPGSHFTAVVADEQGTIWAGLRNEGVVRLDATGESRHFRDPQLREVQALLALDENRLLAASAAGLFEISGNRVTKLAVEPDLNNPGIPALFRTKDDEIFYSHMQGNYRLRRVGTRWQSQPLGGPERIRQWARTKDGRLWALGQFAGLVRLQGNAYLPASGGQDRKSRTWHAIHADSDDYLWLGNSEGLHVYSVAEQRFLGEGPLLPGDHIFFLLPDAHGMLWCATRRGLIRLDRRHALETLSRSGRELLAERFGEDQALSTTNFGLATSSGGALGADGRMWFPGLLGLVSFHPDDFARQARPPIALLSSLELDGALVDLNRIRDVPASTQKLSFRFQTIRQDALGGEFCRFRMVSFDATWRSCMEARQAEYTNLRPGDYEFQLQTSSQAASWNGPLLRLPLTLRAAWYEQPVTQALALLACLGLATGLGWRRRLQARERTRWLEQKVEERTQSLAQATQAAEAASRAKGEFLATMSHEIRTPMNGVLGAVQLLAQTQLNLEQRQLVEVIQQSGDSLVAIVDDVLNLAKVEAGKVTIEKKPVRLPEFLTSLVALFEPKARQKGIHLRAECDALLPVEVLVDAQRLRQVLLNLIGNAVKFTEQGEVVLRSFCRGERLCFAVRDTGIGIPADALPRLFEPFMQVDSSSTRKYAGTGLGLAIVQRLAQAMEGTIAVESTLGQGSVFHVELPLEVAPHRDEPVARVSRRTLRVGLNVLLAEDHPVNQLLFQRMLMKLGCEVHLVCDGQQALSRLREQPVDLVLMDCLMPELDGWEATRELRSWGGSYAHLPVIAITASALPEDREKCFAAGMSDFISKPLMLEELEEKIQRWTSKTEL